MVVKEGGSAVELLLGCVEFVSSEILVVFVLESVEFPVTLEVEIESFGG